MWKLKVQAITKHLLSEFCDDRPAGFSSTSKTKNGVLTKRNPFAECNTANHQPLVTSKAFKIGVCNTSCPHDQLMVDANPGFEFVSQDTTSSTRDELNLATYIVTRVVLEQEQTNTTSDDLNSKQLFNSNKRDNHY
ncbi:hypothetical protein OUZ56_016651 [Daphnia magna]|uniref:Uncharacterized protein n=1 Tax=Daphnia magna TaxID=35525 RepID=A0ABR0AR48_9CRUS|nr:hypothetical protein OUZ56_016651 [Daphnia magna]